MRCWVRSEFAVLARALLRRVSHAKRTCGPLLFVIGHTPHQRACFRAGVSLGGGHSQFKPLFILDRSLPICQQPRQWSAATFGMPMTNSKGPLGTLGIGLPCGAA
jgi:hypothetical protein